ncbi:hypothetical protein GW17_00024442 [Ensete ventricosum]|nr:hypothetical protein GW17_00024442 [Ensete ventricosum]
MRTAPPPLVLLLLLGLASAASAAFTCNATGVAATCRSLVGFKPAQNTTYGAIASLFQVSNSSLFSANGLLLTASADGAVAAGSTVRVPIRCRCANGTGRSTGTVYTVQNGDVGLYNITVARFSNLTTYQEIGEVNQLPDVNKIVVGQELRIPLPCSCDDVDGAEVVHLAHVVAPESSVESIATEFGTKASTLLRLNGMSDPKALMAYQVLDVPLHGGYSTLFTFPFLLPYLSQKHNLWSD